MKTKLISRFILLFVSVAIFFIIFQIYSIRTIAVEASKNEAVRISELVKNGLTAHMVNGTMNKRSNFINAITSMKEIKSLWIIRGDKVAKDYGLGGNYEQPRDDIDYKVLKTGKIYSKFDDDIFGKDSSVRITIPYKAVATNQINCFDCHNVKYNDVLGAISIELDITYIKQLAKESLYLILIGTIILVFVIIILTTAILKPYLETFERIGFSVTSSTNGTFHSIEKPNGLTKGKEADKLIDNYNYFIDELKTSFTDIDNKLRNFTGENINASNNAFVNTKRIINNLSDIYNFKKQIEIDATADDIYLRVGQVLKNKFNINNFNFTIFDDSSKISTVVWSAGIESKECDTANDFDLCRAYKISQDVHTISDHKACSCFEDENNFLHYCLPFKLMDNSTLVIKLLIDTQDEFDNLKNKNITYIKKYLEEVIPALKMKYILSALNESVYKDALTGLYNRKFFEEEAEVLMPLAKREKFEIAVLMLDMDHFKAVNDEHGHDIGDQVLKMFANVIKESIRESDIAIRMGGEEFLVLLINTDEDNAISVANKLRKNVSTTAIKLPNGDDFYKTISTGVSMYPRDSEDISQVVKNSDIALYVAKDSGRNKVIKWEEKQTSPIELF